MPKVTELVSDSAGLQPGTLSPSLQKSACTTGELCWMDRSHDHTSGLQHPLEQYGEWSEGLLDLKNSQSQSSHFPSKKEENAQNILVCCTKLGSLRSEHSPMPLQYQMRLVFYVKFFKANQGLEIPVEGETQTARSYVHSLAITH